MISKGAKTYNQTVSLKRGTKNSNIMKSTLKHWVSAKHSKKKDTRGVLMVQCV